MKAGLLKDSQTPYLYYAVFAVLVFGLHLFLSVNTGDDLAFVTFLDNQTLLQFLSHRYETWTSRLLIETAVLWAIQYPWLWKLLDTAMLVLTAVGLSKLIPAPGMEQERNIFIILLCLLYPFTDMSSAGWLVTTVNYVWPLALGVVALLPLKKVLFGENFRRWEYPLYVAALIFAANNEQMCALLLGFYGIFFVYALIKRKFKAIIGVQMGLALISLIFILTCPGNEARYTSEVLTWFPTYGDISFLGKLELGFSSTLYHYVMAPDFVFLFFSLLVFACVVQQNSQRPLIAICSGLPLAAVLIFGIFGEIFSTIVPIVATLRKALTNSGTGVSFASPHSFLPDLVLLAVLALLVLGLYGAFDNKRMAFLNILILFAGFCSRLIMGFSPTIWASADRTFIFMYFAIIICCVFLGMELLKMNRSWFYRSCALLAVLALLTYLNNLYQLPL